MSAACGLAIPPGGGHPARGGVRFAYHLEATARTRLVILDAVGRRVRMVHSRDDGAGDHEATWDGLDDRGRPCPAGIYFGNT